MLLLAAALALSAPTMAAEDQGAPLGVPAKAQPAKAQPDPLLRIQQARSYRAQRLELLPELEFTPGHATVYHDPWYRGHRRYYGYHPVTVIHSPPTAQHSWGIYQGGARIDVPTYLQITGQLERYQEVDRDLTKYTRRSRVGYSLAGVGVAALVGGTVARGLVNTREAYEVAAWTTLGGAGLAIGGLIGGAVPSGRADVLRNRPSEYMSSAEVRRVTEDYNDALARDLGLSPQDQTLIDSDRIPVRRR